MEKKKTVFHEKWFRRGMILFFSVIAAGILLVAGTNLYMISSVKGRILTAEEAAGLDADCILVLGCGVSESGMPSPVLSDRLNRGIDLYEAGVSQKLLMSGDHGRTNYDEVNAMKNYAIDRGIPSENVFMDHAGFSTYESMYRARDIFRAEKIVIVSQEYHLARSVYLAKALGLDAYGVAADDRAYYGRWKMDVREALARSKDFFSAVIQPEPTYLGEAIPVSGNGDLTNDK